MCDCGTQYNFDWWWKGGDCLSANKEMWRTYFGHDESIPEGQVLCGQCGEQYEEGTVHICQPMEENNERVDGSES